MNPSKGGSDQEGEECDRLRCHMCGSILPYRRQLGTSGLGEAVHWYRQAAGHADSMFSLGVCYTKGEGVDRECAVN